MPCTPSAGITIPRPTWSPPEGAPPITPATAGVTIPQAQRADFASSTQNQPRISPGTKPIALSPG